MNTRFLNHVPENMLIDIIENGSANPRPFLKWVGGKQQIIP